MFCGIKPTCVWLLSMKVSSKNFIFLLVVVSFFACKRPESITWNTDMKLPLISADLNISQLFKDTNIVSNTDETISVVVEEELYKINPLDSMVAISVAPFTKSLTVDELGLDDISINQDYTMGQILADAGLTIVADGSQIPSSFLSVLGTIDPDPINLDVTQYFQTAVLSNGAIDLIIDNKLPLDIVSLDFSIINVADMSTVFTKNVGLIPAGSIYQDLDYDLAAALNGDEIQGQLQVVASNIQAAVPNGVSTITINYADYIKFGVGLKNLSVSEATAIFPAQTVTDYREEIQLDVDNGVELTSGTMREGRVRVKVRSTIPTELYLDYTIPSATKDGQVYSLSKTIPAATSGTVEADEYFPLDGYTFDFTGVSQNEVNKFYNDIKVDIQPTNTPVRLTTADTLFVEISVDGLKPQDVTGYLGQKSYTIQEIILTDVFDDPLLNQIDFKTINLGFDVVNTFGIPSKVTIDNLSVIGNQGAGQAVLSSNTIDLPATTSMVSKGVDVKNGKSLVELNPYQVNIDLDLELNPEGNTPPNTNTATNQEYLAVNIKLDIPLEFSTSNYLFSDSSQFDGINYDLSDLNETTLTLVGKNTFPIEMVPIIYFADSDGVVFDSLVTTERILAADIDVDGRTKGVQESFINYPISVDRLESLLAASNVYFNASLSTYPADEAVVLYAGYYLKLSLVGGFDYSIKSKL